MTISTPGGMITVAEICVVLVMDPVKDDRGGAVWSARIGDDPVNPRHTVPQSLDEAFQEAVGEVSRQLELRVKYASRRTMALARAR